jgi:hypothetical protein
MLRTTEGGVVVLPAPVQPVSAFVSQFEINLDAATDDVPIGQVP